MSSIWKNYNARLSYDGYFTDENKLRNHAKIISSILEKYGNKKLQEIERNCQSTISARGINFRVYATNNVAEDKKWPLDIIPRIIPRSQWIKISKGLIQPSSKDLILSRSPHYSFINYFKLNFFCVNFECVFF